MQTGAFMKNPNPLNRIGHIAFTVLKVLFIIIYGVGLQVEKVIGFVARPLWLFIAGGWFRAVCALGEWVLSSGARLGHQSVHAGQVIARSFVHDFAWWAPSIGAVCILAVLIASNFFSVAIEVQIGENVVGYVESEEEYQAMLSQVEADIQVLLDQNARAEEDSGIVAPTTKEESDKNQNIIVSATASEDSDKPSLESLHLEGESYALTANAKYTLNIVKKNELANEEDLYSGVYAAVSELVGKNYGLYVDGTLKAACADEKTIQKVLDSIKKPYETGEAGSRIEFVEDVVVKKGMFAADTLKTEEELRAMFETEGDGPAYYICEEGDYLSTVAAKFDMTTAQLKALNPGVKETEIYAGRKLNIAAADLYLRVKTVKTEIYTDDIPFGVKREQNKDMYVGTTKTKSQGIKGVKRVTAEITYIDGKRVGKTIVDTEVIEKPVDKVIYVGAKKRYTSSGSSGGSSYQGGYYSQGSGAASGNFTNPLPGSYVSCGWYGYSGHRAVDLCIRGGTLGKSVIAADGGTVEYSGWMGGYGNFVRIRHNNGFVTCYAHLSTRFVAAGDKVSKGQTIGKAGSTGNSTGPHLHFEIRYNGTAVNPMNYI